MSQFINVCTCAFMCVHVYMCKDVIALMYISVALGSKRTLEHIYRLRQQLE